MSAALAPPPGPTAGSASVTPAVSPPTAIATPVRSSAAASGMFACHAGTAVLAAVSCLVFSWLAAGRLWHTDLWDHLNYGKHVLQTRSTAATEPLLPLAAGIRMVNIPWLAQVGMKLTETAVGLAGLQLLSALCGAVAVFLVAHKAARVSRSTLAGLCAAAIFYLINRHELQVIRPQLAGLVCYCVTLTWALGSQTHSLKHWLGFVAMFALWANLHGSFAMGLFVLAASVAGRAVDVFMRSRCVAVTLGDHQLHRNMLLLQLCSVAVLLNPNGLLVYPEIFAVSGNANTASMFEWQPLTLRLPHGQIAAAVLAAAVLCLRFSPRPIRCTEVLIFAGTGLLAAWSARMLNWWAPAAAILVAKHLAAVLRPQLTRLRFRHPARPSIAWTTLSLTLVAVSFAVSPLGAQLRTGRPPSASASLSRETPIAAARFLREQKNLPAGIAWIPAEWAGFIMNQTQLSLPSMVNLHVHLIPEEVWSDYLRINAGSADWVNLLDEYGINLVVIDKQSQALLLKRMRESSDWQGLYEDRQAVVLTRRKPL